VKKGLASRWKKGKGGRRTPGREVGDVLCGVVDIGEGLGDILARSGDLVDPFCGRRRQSRRQKKQEHGGLRES
jgi:hypothetical protein